MRRRARTGPFTCALLVATALLAAACAPFTGTPPAQVTPLAGVTAVATQPRPTAAATTGAAGQAGLFAGTVKHAGQPVPNARVELRSLGWASSKTPALATIQADAQGNFSLPNPPAGDFSVVGYFPDGEMDAGGWPPVSIKAGQQVKGFVVPLERKIILLSPIVGSPVSAKPTLTWKPAAGAVAYRVWVIDAGTTEVKLDKTVQETSLVAPAPLPAAEYQWVVNGLDAAGQVVATGQETFTVKTTGADTGTPNAGSTATPSAGAITTPGAAGEGYGLPPSCQPRPGQTAVFSDPEHGFCFTYPANFRKNEVDPGQVNVVGVVSGPALDSSPDPLAATLLIDVQVADTPDLKSAVAAVTSEFAGQAGVNITERPFLLNRVPASLLEGVPGRGGSRDIVTVQNGFRYRLIFMPDPKQGFPQVEKDLQALFDAVTASFTFLPPTVTESQGPVPRPGNMPRLPDDERAFAGAREMLAKKLGVDPLAIQRVEVTPQEWNDACLGVTVVGEMCAQVITPGWTVIMQTGGQRYEAHTNQDGTHVRLVGGK